MGFKTHSCTRLWRLLGVLCVLVGVGEEAAAQTPGAADSLAEHRMEPVAGAPLSEALRALVQATGVPLVYADALVAEKRTRCEQTRGSTAALLRCVLNETGLSARRLPSGTYVLEEAAPEKRRGVLRGQIRDRRTGTPVPFASVAVEGTFVGTAADEAGRFRLPLPSEDEEQGPLTVRVRAVGYEAARRTVDASRGDELGAIDLALRPKQVQLGSVTIEGERIAAAAEVDPSRHLLRPETARNAPALGEPDVARTLALLPGVSQANDMKAALNVRGGASDQNQFLIDGVEVYNPHHLFGVNGAFNLWALDDADVHVGDFPVRYGGRLSSVVALQSRSVPADSAFAKANLSLISASGAYARRFGKTGVGVAARRTYADPVLALLPLDLTYNFYDANLKVTHPLGNVWGGRLSAEALGFASRDALSGSPDSPDPDDHFNWSNRMAALRVKHEGAAWRQRLTASYVGAFARAYREDQERDYVDDRLRDLTVRYRGTRTFRKRRLSFGAAVKHFRTGNAWNELNDNELYFTETPDTFDQATSAPLYSAYLSGEGYWTPRLNVQGGLRYAVLGSGQAGTGVLQPRVQLSYEASEAWTLTAGAGRYAQHVSEGSEGDELKIQQPTFLLERPQTAWSVSAGAAWTPSARYRLSGEAYARRFERFARFGKAVAQKEKISRDSEFFPDPNVAFPDFAYGTGRAFGLDLFFQKTRGWITGQLAYSFTQTRLDFGASPYPPAWSIPHSLQGLIGLRVGRWRVNVAGTVRSGRPYTPVRGRFFGPGAERGGGLQEQFLLGAPHSARFPRYTRVDLSLRRTYTAESFDWTLYLQALNLFNHVNPQRLASTAQYYRSGIERESGVLAPPGVRRSLPVIPSVGVEFTF